MDLCTIPIAQDPSGAPPNFADPQGLRGVTCAICATLGALACIFVGLRLVPAPQKKSRLYLGDWCCIAGLVFTIGFAVTVALSTPSSDTPVCWMGASWFKILAASGLLLAPASTFAKASVGTLYLRIFGSVTWLRYTVRCVLVFFTWVFMSQVPVWTVFYFPYGSEGWTLVSLLEKMNSTKKYSTFVGATNLVADFFFLIIPLPIIIRLKLSLRKRIGLAAVFLTAAVAVAVTTLGMYYRIDLFFNPWGNGNLDPIWKQAMMEIIVVIETFTTIIVSCVPGCVSVWRNVLSDKPTFVALRALLPSSPTPSPLLRPSFVRSGEAERGAT